MANEVVVRAIDARLGVSLAQPTPYDILVDAGMGLAAFCEEVKRRVQSRKIARLQINSHAFYEEEPTPKARDYPGEAYHRYGFGIQFSADGIYLKNADTFAALNGRFASRLLGIEFYGCGAAAVSRFQRDGEMRVGDGIALCQAIANAAGTGVLASPEPQPSTCRETVGRRVVRNGASIAEVEERVIDECTLGPWSGLVWHFKPGATAPKPWRRP